MNINVFGGSKPQPGSPAYQQAYTLGKLLAEAGHTVLNGGYIGTMEAVSRGANEAGGTVIGVTCGQIEAWRPVAPNKWITEEVRFKTLPDRMFYLIDTCDAAIALPGGVGTLAEISMMWNLVQTESIPMAPMILVGAGWRSTFETFFRELDEYIAPAHRELLHIAPDEQAAFQTLQTLLS